MRVVLPDPLQGAGRQAGRESRRTGLTRPPPHRGGGMRWDEGSQQCVVWICAKRASAHCSQEASDDGNGDRVHPALVCLLGGGAGGLQCGGGWMVEDGRRKPPEGKVLRLRLSRQVQARQRAWRLLR